MKNGCTQQPPPELFLFVKIQKWSCYPGGGSCFPCSSATWHGQDLRLNILSTPYPSSIKASLFPRHSLLLAGKSAQAAVETDWLRRRPGRCTEDKFVFVSRAATLGGRTLSRSCQILPPLKNTLMLHQLKENKTVPSYFQLYLHPRPPNIIAVGKGERPTEPSLSSFQASGHLLRPHNDGPHHFLSRHWTNELTQPMVTPELGLKKHP